MTKVFLLLSAEMSTVNSGCCWPSATRKAKTVTTSSSDPVFLHPAKRLFFTILCVARAVARCCVYDAVPQ